MTHLQRETALLKKNPIKFQFNSITTFAELILRFFSGQWTYNLNNSAQSKFNSRTLDDFFLITRYYKIPLSYADLAKILELYREKDLVNYWICSTIHKRVHCLKYSKRDLKTIENSLRKLKIKNFKIGHE